MGGAGAARVRYVEHSRALVVFTILSYPTPRLFVLRPACPGRRAPRGGSGGSPPARSGNGPTAEGSGPRWRLGLTCPNRLAWRCITDLVEIDPRPRPLVTDMGTSHGNV